MDQQMKPQRRSRVPLLTAVLAAQAVFYIGLQIGAHFPMERRSAAGESPLTRWRQSRTDPRKELRPGAAAPQELVGKGRGMGTAVLFLGDRDDCGTRSLMASWREAVRKRSDMDLVLVAHRFDKELRLPCEGKAPRPRIILDPEDRLARLCNASWTPRSYVLDRLGRVVYVQPPGTPDSRAPGEALGVTARETMTASAPAPTRTGP